MFSIGILMDSLKEDVKTSIELAAQMGVKGLQLYATKGEYSPEEMDNTKRKSFLIW